MIEIKNVNFKYKNSTRVLNNINLNIKQGEFVTVIGKNGSGKSTLARLISGIYKPESGDILVDEISTNDKKRLLELRKKIGIVFQNPENQIIFPNVYDDMEFALKNLKLENRKDRIEKALAKVGMSGYEKKDTYSLSLGQKQRITIAGVLAIDTPYIVLDEPTTMIDSKGKEDFYKVILELKKAGYTIIYITNLIDEILMSDRVIVLENGTVKQTFLKEDILENIDILKNSEIKIPEIVQQVANLKEHGINISLKEWTIGEMVKELVKDLKK